MTGNVSGVNTTMTNKIIYTRRIAMKLIEAGNIPAGTMPNPSKPEFLTWIFAETPKFSNDLAKILGEQRPGRDRGTAEETSAS